MRVFRGTSTRQRVIGAPVSNSSIRPLMIALITGVVLSVMLHRSWGAAACPGTLVVTKVSTKCSRPASGVAKGAAKVSAAAAVSAAPAAGSTPVPAWKSVLDPLNAGGWDYISDGPAENPSAVYASTHNVLHNGNVVTAWMRWEFARPQAEVYPLHYLSAVTREELDCDARSYRRAAVIYYTRNNLQEKGPSFTALNDDTTWKVAIPGSEPDAMLNWGCSPPALHAALKSSAKPSVASKPAPVSSAPAAASAGTELHTTR